MAKKLNVLSRICLEDIFHMNKTNGKLIAGGVTDLLSGRSRISETRGRQPPSLGRKHFIWKDFHRKLHEN